MIMCNRLHLFFSPQILTPPGFQRRSNGVTVALGGLWLFLSQSWGHFHHSPWPKSRFFSSFYCYLLFFLWEIQEGKALRTRVGSPYYATHWHDLLVMDLGCDQSTMPGSPWSTCWKLWQGAAWQLFLFSGLILEVFLDFGQGFQLGFLVVARLQTYSWKGLDLLRNMDLLTCSDGVLYRPKFPSQNLQTNVPHCCSWLPHHKIPKALNDDWSIDVKLSWLKRDT